MSYVLYEVGSYAVKLDLVSTRSVSTQPVGNGPDSLYARWRCDWVGHVNTRLNPVVVPGTAVDAQGNPTAPGFDRQLSSSPAAKSWFVGRLMRAKRGRLSWYDDNGRLYVQCPTAGMDLDARIGVNPVQFEFLTVSGSEDVLVNWVVEFDLSDCFSPPLILSNRWTATDEVDPRTHLVTRTTRGSIVFHVAQLRKLGLIPDALRGFVAPPVPTNFHRQVPEITAMPDGDGLRYTVVDEERSHPWTRYCSYLEAYQESGFTQPGAGLAQDAAHFLGMGKQFLVGLFKAAPTAGASVPGALLNITADHAVYSAAKLPQFWTVVVVKAWGNRFTTRDRLQRVCLAVATERLRPLIFKGATGASGHEATVRHDLVNKYVELRMAVRHGPGQGAGGYLQPLALPGIMAKAFPADETVKTGNVVLVTDKDAAVAAPPFSNGTRGTAGGKGGSGTPGWSLALLAQWLKDACANPAAPALYGYTFTGAPPPIGAGDPDPGAPDDTSGLTTQPPVTGSFQTGGKPNTLPSSLSTSPTGGGAD